MIFKIIKLKFKSPLHIHRGKGDYDMTEPVLHSDTLSSAICAMGYRLYDDFDSETIMDNFRVSSAFPFYDDICFLPKPMVKLPIKISGYDEKSSSKEAKVLKKLEYLDINYFEKVIQSSEIFEIGKDKLKIKGKFLTNESIRSPFSLVTQQRVTVARDNSESMPYYIERIVFDKNSGLYFIIEYNNEQILEKIVASLCLLGDEGIGTDKNVGNGQFDISIGEIEIEVPEKADKKMILSLYCPKKEEVKNNILNGSAYQLMKRGGYLAGAPLVEHRHLKKKSVYMFSEASVFTSDKKLDGKIVNLRPEWNDDQLPDIWRSGKPISIPINTLN